MYLVCVQMINEKSARWNQKEFRYLGSFLTARNDGESSGNTSPVCRPMLVVNGILHQRSNHGRILVEIWMLCVDVSRLNSNNVLNLPEIQLVLM
jgi:hypothetical protein